MTTLYLLEPGTSLFKKNLRFIIYNSKKDKLEVPIREVENILLFGNINLSTAVISTCLESSINILFLSSYGRYKGHLWNKDFSNLNIELQQYKNYSNSVLKLAVSKAIVKGKLINSKQLLLRLNRHRKTLAVQKIIVALDSYLKKIDFVSDIDRLRGYEGVGAARYFSALGQLITNTDFAFSQRHRQPPTDPINALLSFGYTLLFNNVISLIITEGLSPYFGNLHYGERKKPYLAFDLMEEFRSPIVDSLIISLVNKKIIQKEDFDTNFKKGGIYLTDKSRRKFLNEFEKRVNQQITHPIFQTQLSYRDAIQLQIRLYKRSLISSDLYQPFLRSA